MKLTFNLRIIGFSAILLLLTGLSFGQNIRSTKTIRIKDYTHSFTISLEYDSAIVSFSLQEVRDQLIKAKTKKKFQGKDFQTYFSETLREISANKDYHFKHKENFSAGGIIEQYALRTIISKGKSKVFNKLTNNYVNRIKRTHYKVTIAGERHQGYEFAFMDGTIFLIDMISI